MSLDENFTIDHVELITKGLHKFRINDIKLKTIQKDEQTYDYIVFELLDLEDNKEYDKLLTIPLSSKAQFSERSKLHQVLKKLNVKIDKDFKLTGKLLNSFIYREFSAIVTYIDQFAEIDVKTIILESINSQDTLETTAKPPKETVNEDTNTESILN